MTTPPAVFTQDDLERMARSFNDFGLHLLAHLAAAARGPRNLVIAPFALASELAMTYLGAGGETAAAFSHLLRLDGAHRVDAIARALLNELLGADPQASLHIANSLWVDAQYPAEPDFIQRVQTHFDAHVGAIDATASELSANAINQWIHATTAGKIGQLVNAADVSGAALLLISAVYFKAAWATMFESDATAPAAFTRADGSICQTPFMHLHTELTHRCIDNVQLVFLPFSAGRLGMVLALPPAMQPFHEFQRKLDVATWSAWLQDFGQDEGDLALPRFTMRSDLHLDRALREMGLQVAFSSAADFHKIGPGALQISDCQHAVMLDVNEEGAEASTAKAKMMFRSLAPPPLKIVFDRPFLAAIVDIETEAILFAGYIGDPSEGMAPAMHAAVAPKMHPGSNAGLLHGQEAE